MGAFVVTVLLDILDQARQAVLIGMSAPRELIIATPIPHVATPQVVTPVRATPAIVAMVSLVWTTTNVWMVPTLVIAMLLARTRLVASPVPVTSVSWAMDIPVPTSTNVAPGIMVGVIHLRRVLTLLEAITALPAPRATQEPERPVVSRLSLPLLILARVSWSHPGLPLILIRSLIPAGDTRPVTLTDALAIFHSGRRCIIIFGQIGWWIPLTETFARPSTRSR